MDNAELARRFATLTTVHIADGCLRAGVSVRCAPAGTRAAIARTTVAGRVLPARHAGSVDVFLEALGLAEQGDVLVVPYASLDLVLGHAETIRDTERRQAALVDSGTSLRRQLRFGEYLGSGITFREHLRGVGGEIEV